MDVAKNMLKGLKNQFGLRIIGDLFLKSLIHQHFLKFDGNEEKLNENPDFSSKYNVPLFFLLDLRSLLLVEKVSQKVEMLSEKDTGK